MKRVWIVGLLITLLAGAKFGYEYFYFDQNQVGINGYVNPPAKIITLPQVPADSLSSIVVTPEAVQQALNDLGIPAGKVDGKWGQRTRQGFCIWRELTGRNPDRNYPIEFEQREIILLSKTKKSFALNEDFVKGLNVNKACQSVIWVKDGARKDYEISIVSTGASATPTDVGTFKVGWKVNRWYESISIPDGWMYRPMFFNKGQAIHGVESDNYVWWYPASHGCVRLLGAFVDKLWAAGFGEGDTVRVYGEYNPVTTDPLL